MIKAINITPEENNKVYNLFNTYNAYLSILHYFMNNGTVLNKEAYNEKWDETVKLSIELDKAKHEIEKKYKPEGIWDRFEFDFDNQQVVFITNGT